IPRSGGDPPSATSLSGEDPPTSSRRRRRRWRRGWRGPPDGTAVCRAASIAPWIGKGTARFPSAAEAGRSSTITANRSVSDALRDRQLEGERRPFALCRRDPHPPLHSLDELAADVEAQPGAAHPAGHVRVDAVEALEDVRLLVRRDPDSLVADAEADDGVNVA